MGSHARAHPRAERASSPERTTSAHGTASERGRWWIEGLDGWRALAIVAVLIFHLRPGTLPGGFIGVDVFFVISGFLITTLLVRELNKNGKIDLPRFWVRRARRLLPALFTVVTISTVAAFFAGGDLLVGIGRHILGALTFSNNWVEIAVGSDYFGAATPNLFMNFWSLAVEEQFYLLWPVLAIVIMAALPTGRARLYLLLGGAAVSVIAMAALYSPDAITRVYYGTDTHAFGLLIGAALAFAMAAPDLTFFDTQRWQRLRVPLALGGFAVVVTLMMTVNGDGAFAYRGGLLLASLATAAMVASLPGRETRLTAVLKARPIEWVGLRSYGIYLWHWPVILIVDAAWPPAAPDAPSWWLSRAVALGATLGLAALSFQYVENPIRQHGFREVGTRLRRWWTAIPARGKTLAGVTSAAFVLLLGVAVASAPTESALERSMLEAERFVEEADPALGDGASADAPNGGAEAPSGEAAAAGPGGADSPETEEAAMSGAEPEASAEPEAGEEEPGADTSGPVQVPGAEVYGVGDSMMYVAAPGLSKQIPGMTINAESNRQWPAMITELRSVVEQGKVGPVVVLAAGTNAGARDISVVEEAVGLLGEGRRIVLVNIYSGSSFVEETNENYAAVAEEHSNVAVANWNAAAVEHPDQLQPDKIHPNMQGMHLWADTVLEALTGLEVTIE